MWFSRFQIPNLSQQKVERIKQRVREAGYFYDGGDTANQIITVSDGLS